MGPDKNLSEVRKTLEDKYRLKVEVLGGGAGQVQEMRILNKVVRSLKDGLELEADPRHAKLAVKDLGLGNSKTTAVPGSKEEAKRVSANPVAVTTGQERATTKARLSLESDLDSIQSARQSVADDRWDVEEASEVAMDGDDNDVVLGDVEARLYRGVAARLNYISPDRPDIGYAVKEAARSMSSPCASDLRRLRKIGKYLLGKPRLVSLFKWQEMPTRITTFTDSDWAGCARSAKSTSGGAVCLGEHVIKTYCRQQKVIALSSAEAELYAMVAASAETLALAAYARDLGLSLDCELYCDSAAALGISQRAGIGKVRHLRTQGLWVQEVRISGRITYKKVLGEKNPADLLTKHMSAELAGRHLGTLNMKLSEGRATSAPTLDSLVQARYFDDGVDSVDQSHDNERRVRFDTRVSYQPIPAEGKGRRTPARGSRPRDGSGQGLDTIQDEIYRGIDESIIDRVDECICGGLDSRARTRWGDWDDDPECLACARSWSLTPPAAVPRVSLAQSNNFVSSDCRLGFRRTCNRLSGGHLEGSRPVPTSGGRPNSPAVRISPSHKLGSAADSALRRRRRRSVGGGPSLTGSGNVLHSHMRSRVHARSKVRASTCI